jgi:hypothetical protein
MLLNASHQETGDANVEDAAFAGHDVKVVALAARQKQIPPCGRNDKGDNDENERKMSVIL